MCPSQSWPATMTWTAWRISDGGISFLFEAACFFFHSLTNCHIQKVSRARDASIRDLDPFPKQSSHAKGFCWINSRSAHTVRARSSSCHGRSQLTYTSNYNLAKWQQFSKSSLQSTDGFSPPLPRPVTQLHCLSPCSFASNDFTHF